MMRDALQASPLVILQAPFGYGKTTLLDAALHDRDDAAVFRAQPWHRGTFIEDLVLAVREVRPDFGRRTLAGAADAAPLALARSFVTDLRHVPAELVLAIDNAEQVAEDSVFAEFIANIANDLPKHVHMLISGRSVPHLPAQTRMNRAVTIPPEALLFGEEELGAALESNGMPSDESAVERIAHATKGWPASVSLALRARNNGTSLESDELGLAYIAESMAAVLDPDTSRFLERISVFERIEPRLLANEAGYGDVERLLDNLEIAGAPITPDGSGYTLHPLVRRFGQAQLDASGDAPQAHAMAAGVFARQGNLNAALFHVKESADEDIVDAFMREFGASIVRTADHDAIRNTLQLLRSSRTSDVRAYINALLTKSAGGTETKLHLAIAAGSDDPRIAFAARAERIELSIARTGSADATALHDLAERAEELGTDARAAAALLQAWSSAVSLDFERALARLEPFHDLPDRTTRFNAGVLYAYARACLGDADAALDELDSLVRLFENDDRVVLETLTLVWQARVALLFNRTAVASDAARAALRLMENLSIGAEEAALYFALTELATHEGDVARTVAFAERLSTSAPRAWYAGDAVRARAFAETALARAAFLGRDIPTARDLAIRAAETTDFPSPLRSIAYAEASTYAALLGDERARTLALRAFAAVKQAEPRDAADAVALATAIDLAGFLGNVHDWRISKPETPRLEPFKNLLDTRRGLVTMDHAAIAFRNLRTGKATQEPFNAALAQIERDGQRFEVRLLRAFVPRESQPVPPPSTETFDLTAREMEILVLLVDGLSNKEIAQRLVLSPRTVETHVERVLGKLEVGSRSRAIAKALRLGLVSLVDGLDQSHLS